MSATNRGSKRHPNDNYPTPTEAIIPILKEINFKKVKSFLEPCKGIGNIYDAFTAVCPWSSRESCEITEGKDYLLTEYKNKFDLILTNPPFSQAIQFLNKSLDESDCVIYLLRLNFLGSQKRKLFWENNPPTHLFVLSKRPSFDGNGTDATEYAWFCWDKSGVIKKNRGIYVL